MIVQDVRIALRQLRKNPGFTALAAMTLALGIAANATIFAWINATILDPIPGIRRTGPMIALQMGERSEHPSPPFSYPDFVDLRAGVRSFSGMIGYHDDWVSITGGGKPQRIYGALTTADYFEVLGVRPILGRGFLPDLPNERLAAPEAVLGYGLWQSRYGGDPSIMGKTIEINLHPYTIVGIAPKGFHGCKTGLRADIWLPIGNDRQVWGSQRIEERGASWLNVLGVLKSGVTAMQAEHDLNLVMQRLVEQYPEPHQGATRITSDPLWRSPFGANVYLYGTLPTLLALAAVLLLLACANVANLLLVRTVSRRREFAIRMSMGANRWSLVRQLMVENLMVALLGGVAALLATMWTAGLLAVFMPGTTLPIELSAHVDGRVLAATILAAVLTAMVSGVAPALRAAGLSPAAVLKDESLSTTGGLHKSRLTGGLVVAQVALSLLLLTCAGLFVRSLQNAQKMNPGFDAENVFLVTFDLDPMGYSNERGSEFQRQVTEQVRALPGVESAVLADFSPLSFTIHSDGVLPEGYVPRPHETIEVDRGKVGPGYLAAMRTPLIAGRDFTAQDNESAQPVAIVNQAFVNRYWPGQNAIGKRFKRWDSWYTVVGVAANGKYRRLVYDAAPLVLIPLMQRYDNEVILHVRTKGDPRAIRAAVEQAIHALNADLPLYNETTLKESMQMGNVFERIAVTFAGSFGVLALILSAVGIYGVVAYTTKQRTHEIGIRMALGAGRADVFGSVLRQGMRLTLAGLGLGFAVSLVATRSLRGMLYGIGSADWVTFATVGLILCAVALLACFVPARRAAAVEPMRALRTE